MLNIRLYTLIHLYIEPNLIIRDKTSHLQKMNTTSIQHWVLQKKNNYL